MLLVGTGIAQLAPLIAAPILSRLYTPGDFGVFALFLVLTSVLPIFATGRYEIAILLPSDDADAKSIVDLAVALGAAFSAITVPIVLIFRRDIATLLSEPALARWLLIVPVMVFLTATYQSYNYWFNRRSYYKQLAIIRIGRSSSAVLAMCVLGSGITSGGLIVGTVVGQAWGTVAFLWLWRKDDIRKDHRVSLARCLSMARRYKRFAIYSVPGDTLYAFSQQLPVVMLGYYFNSSVVGQYNLTQRALAGPEAIVAVAIGDVFRQRAGHDMAHQGNCRRLWTRTFVLLIALSIPPFGLLALFSPRLFVTVFGAQWSDAGRYAQLLTPFFMLSFTGSILGRTMYITERQREDLLWQITTFVVLMGALVVGGLNDSAETSIALFSLGYSAMYVVYLFMSFVYSNGARRGEGRA